MKAKIKKVFKKYITDSPLTIKIIIGGCVILALSLNIALTCGKDGIKCNCQYDPPEVNQIEKIVK